MHQESLDVKGKEQESTFNLAVENAIIKRVLDLEFILFVLNNGARKLAFDVHKRLLRDNFAWLVFWWWFYSDIQEYQG